MSRRAPGLSMLVVALVLGLGWPTGPTAAQDRSRELPPPPLAPLLRLAAPALEKPPVPLPQVELPGPPSGLPELPPARPAVDWGVRPAAPLPGPRVLACNPLGSVLGVSSELLECGKARFQRGELEAARGDLQAALQKSSDRQVVREARYWLSETLLRLGRRDNVESHLLLVAQDDPRGELGAFASHSLGWILLERGDAARALAAFEPLIRGGAPPDVVPWSRHGRALALYGLRRYPEARDEWMSLVNRSVPRPLATEASFWLGETLGRLGDANVAVRYLQVFTAAGPHPLIETGLLRLAWFRRAAGQPLEAVKTYRGLLSAYPQTAEAPLARVGLVQALVDVGDYAAAREEARQLESRDRTGTLTLPSLFGLARGLVEKNRTDDALALIQELLGRNLDPPARVWVLLLGAEAHRRAGQSGEARTQLELARNAPGSPELGLLAALRLAQLDLEGREFAQALTAAEALLARSLSPPLRAAALTVAGEAAYGARQYDRAAPHFESLVAEFPTSTQAPAAMLALAWTEFRRGKLELARQRWTRFVQERASDPRAPAALLLAAELAANAGDVAGARTLLDRLVSRYPQHELASVAALNRSILAVRAGRSADALRELGRLPPGAPYAGRVRVARGVALVEAGRQGEARSEFEAALAEGEDLARLGLARIALERRQWDQATRELLVVRDAGGGATARAAEYGLAAALFNQGKKQDFARLAGPLLAGPADPATTPHLLAGMADVAAEEKKWPEARALTERLVGQFPASTAAPVALAALSVAAGRDGQWAISRETHQTLIDRYPTSPAVELGQVDFAEALLRTGAAPEARRRLESFVTTFPRDPRAPRAMLLLAEAREATGDRTAALEIYTRLGQDYPAARGAEAAVLAQGRLLLAEGKWDLARPLLERALDNADPAVTAEAAYRLGEGLRGASQHQDAVEFYMTAAYLAPDSPWGRRALLAAGQSFSALKQREAAEIVYRKLGAAKDVEPELADAARKELRALGAQ